MYRPPRTNNDNIIAFIKQKRFEEGFFICSHKKHNTSVSTYSQKKQATLPKIN